MAFTGQLGTDDSLLGGLSPGEESVSEVESTATLGLLAIAADASTGTASLGLLGFVVLEGTAVLGLLAYVTPPLLHLLGAVIRDERGTLGLLGRVQDSYSKSLGLLGIAATDIHTATMGLNGSVTGEALRTLGLEAYVSGDGAAVAYLLGVVSNEVSPTLGLLGYVAAGPELGLIAAVQADSNRTLGLLARVASPGEAPISDEMRAAGFTPFNQFFPSDGRRFAEREEAYLRVVYRNFPLRIGEADIWLWDNTFLPVNGAKMELDEPVKENISDTLAGRTIIVVEQEYDSPRVTRRRTFKIDFPVVGGQLLQWFKIRERMGIQFVMQIQMFDVGGLTWDRLYSDPTEPDTKGYVWWGTFPAWQPGTVRVRRFGTVITPEEVPYTVDYGRGKITFEQDQGEAAELEVQFIYQPKVQIVNIEANPVAGRVFNRFKPKVTLLEVPAGS